jgi:hypothetical protein
MQCNENLFVLFILLMIYSTCGMRILKMYLNRLFFMEVDDIIEQNLIKKKSILLFYKQY